MCLKTSMSNGMSKDIQGQVFKALWHMQGSLGCSCFYTGEEPLRDARGNWVSLGIPSVSCISMKSTVGQSGSSKGP